MHMSVKIAIENPFMMVIWQGLKFNEMENHEQSPLSSATTTQWIAIDGGTKMTQILLIFYTATCFHLHLFIHSHVLLAYTVATRERKYIKTALKIKILIWNSFSCHTHIFEFCDFSSRFFPPSSSVSQKTRYIHELSARRFINRSDWWEKL